MTRPESLFETLYFDYLTPRQRVVVFNLIAQAYNGYYDLKPNVENLPRLTPWAAVLLLVMATPSGTNQEFNKSQTFGHEDKEVVSEEIKPTSTPTLIPTRTFVPVSTPTPTETPTKPPTQTSTPTLLALTFTPRPSFTPTSTQTPSVTSTETPPPIKPQELKPSFQAFFEQTVKIAQDQNLWQVLSQLFIESSIVEKPWVNQENNVSQIDVLVNWVIIYAQRKEIYLDLLMSGDEIKLKMLVTDNEIQQLKRVAETKSLTDYLNLLLSEG